jgi:hypothetical protein
MKTSRPSLFLVVPGSRRITFCTRSTCSTRIPINQTPEPAILEVFAAETRRVTQQMQTEMLFLWARETKSRIFSAYLNLEPAKPAKPAEPRVILRPFFLD